MGKAIKSTISSTHTFAKKNISKKKKNRTYKSPDILKDYLRALSTNFGPNLKKTTEKSTLKRKREHSEIITEVVRKPKVIKEDEVHKANIEVQNITEDTKFNYKIHCLQSEDEIKDLFHIDDNKSSNEYTLCTDWFFHICDELSLEGLDGITLEAFWSRLKNISSYPVLLEGKEQLVWDVLKCIDQIEFFTLENSRGKLVIYDRNSFVCPETGIVLEPMAIHDDIYPYCLVNKEGNKGSCSTYDTREECGQIVKNLSLDEVTKKYGNRLVIVASQAMRENSIVCEIANPNTELLESEYGLLERVGRSRKLGELTQGKLSILNIIKDSRTIFHIRKALEKKKLLKKQFFILRSIATSQNKTGKLLHLPRFHRIQKSKTLLLIEEVVELLRQKKGFSLEFGEFRKYFPRSTGIHKIMKMQEFNKYIRTDIFHPYRHIYPNAKTTEWKYKNRDKEKQLRIFQLIDPTINVSACWDSQDLEQNSDDECVDDESPGNKIIGPEFLKEVFQYIFNKGKDGVTLQELEKNIELDYYTMRIAIRKLQAKNVIDSVRSEHGKQRHILYFARCFHSKIIKIPISKPLKIPPAILQKILQPQTTAKTTNMIKTSNLLLNADKFLRLTDTFSTFPCRAFLKETEPDQKIVTSKEIISLRNLLLRKSQFAFTSSVVNSKFYDIIDVNRRKSWNFAEASDLFYSYKNEDLTMKLVLLKLVIFEMKTSALELLEGNAENTDLENAKIDIEILMNERRSLSFKISHSYTKDYLLGPAPIVLFEETTPENVEVTVILSTPPEQYILEYTSYVTFDKNLTALSLSRTNIILELINKSLIICDIFKLQRSVMEIEVETNVIKSGQGKIDKNTLNRLLLKLSTEGYLKIFKIMLTNEEKFKAMWVVTHPSIEVDHPLFRSIKEQAVIKFFLGMEKAQKIMAAPENIKVKPASSPFDTCEIQESVNKLKEISNTEIVKTYKINRQFGKLLGFQPKFVRLQVLHELLYYLVYDYKVLDALSHLDVEEVLVHYAPEEYQEIPPIYHKSIDWKMFIPPLPKHKDLDTGWSLLCDVLLATPLSLWVKLFHVSLDCRELITYMEHPIRRHYLIKDIPIEFRHVVMFKRKYVFTAVELLYKLCFMGLVQLGPQSPSIKDQLFLYLNKKVSLLDTTSSLPSYHKVTPKPYKTINFVFNSRNDVDDYWCQLWTISMNTPLGQRTVMEGRSVTIENPTYKSTLLDALKAKTSNQAKNNDNGEVPGDKLGAGGLDSSMWPHIKRNWLWTSKSNKNTSSNKKECPNIRQANIAGIKPISIKFRELMNQNRKIFLPAKERRSEHVTSASSKKFENKKTIHRKIQLKPARKPKQRHPLDAKDKAILKRVGRCFRASWSQKEDRLLSVCKAACYLLSQNSSQESYSIIRDVLHALIPESKDKTSAACVRRFIKLWKTDHITKRMKDNARNLLNLMGISKYFSPIIYNLNKSPVKNHYTSHEMKSFYICLMSYMNENIINIEKILQGHTVTLDYFTENNIDTFSPILINVEKKKSVYTNPTVEDDVEKDVVRSVLLSSLSNSKSGQNTSYQLFKIYMKYPDNLIRSVVMALKNRQAISLKKKTALTPLGVRSMPFQLSVFYNSMLKSTLNPVIVHTIYQNFLEITGKTAKFCEIDPSKSIFKYGRFMARNEIAAVWSDINYIFNIPDSAYILNPYIKDQSVLTIELANLYRKHLEKQQKKRKELQSNQNQQYLSKFEPKRKDRDLEIIKLNITRLLTSLPCLCNKKINEIYTLFIETKEEKAFNDYLSIFLESLTGVALNLLSFESDAVRFLQNTTSKYHRSKVINTVSKVLDARICKAGHVIRDFLRNHHLTNIKECFENEYVSKNDECENILRAWLDKTKINGRTVINEVPTETVREQKVQFSFFKYKQSKPQSGNIEIDQLENIPTIYEIIKGMMEPPNPKIPRTIPYISDLASLLWNDKLAENNKDEKVIEDLNGHFIAQYPLLEKFRVDFPEDFLKMPKIQLLFSVTNKEFVLDNISRSFLIGDPKKSAMFMKIRENGGDANDIRLCEEIITYVYNKGVFGAFGEKLKENFESKAKNLSLVCLLKSLVENFLFLRTGIAEIIFVHYDFASSWLVQTFDLLPQESQILQTSGKNLGNLKQKIETRIKFTKQKNVLLMPWIRIDGTLNLPLLEKWLTLVLNYCLDFPQCPLMNLFEKFHHVKPVEIYFLLEVLQDLNCLKINVKEEAAVNLFSDRTLSKSFPASFLDNFKNMYTEVHTLSTCCLGFYLDREVIEFAP